jgi:hypothetical protein
MTNKQKYPPPVNWNLVIVCFAIVVLVTAALFITGNPGPGYVVIIATTALGLLMYID